MGSWNVQTRCWLRIGDQNKLQSYKNKKWGKTEKKDDHSSLLITLIKDEYTLDTSRVQFTRLEVSE